MLKFNLFSLLTLPCFHCFHVTGGIARSASRRYLVYSGADFEVFRPAGATRSNDGAEIWHGDGTYGPLPMPNLTPIGAKTRV